VNEDGDAQDRPASDIKASSNRPRAVVAVSFARAQQSLGRLVGSAQCASDQQR
jgi:hypothetical protein